MTVGSKVTADVLVMPIGGKSSSRAVAKNTWFGIWCGVLIGTILARILDISLPGWFSSLLIYGAMFGYLVAWNRFVFQKKTINLISREATLRDQLVLGVYPSCSMLTLGIGDGDGHTADIPLYRKFTCTKREEDSQVIYTFVGLPAKPFDKICQMVIQGNPEERCVCHKVCKVVVEYAVQGEEDPQWLGKLDDIVAKTSMKPITIPRWAIKMAFEKSMETAGKQQMIYKHAVSTIVSGKPIDLSKKNAKPQEGEENERVI